MKDFLRSRKSVVLLAALVTAFGWVAWNEVSAQPADSEADTLSIDAGEVRAALNDEEKRHAAALNALQKARAGLEAANADTAVIDRLIETEKADHRRREDRLKDWLNSESAQPDDEASRTRSIINRELRDIGKAIGSLNQSISVKPISSPSAQTGGVRFVDYVDAPDHQRKDTDESDEAAAGQAQEETSGSRSSGENRSVPTANNSLGESLFREVPRNGQDRPVENPTGIEQIEAQIGTLSRQLSALQQQLTELKAARKAQQ